MAAQLIDVENGLRQNGNDYLFYMRHLQRFLNDTNMLKLCDALSSGNIEQSFFYAHTLKGITAQLSIVGLYHPFCVLCDLLRDGDCDKLPQARALLPELLEVYDRVVHEIENY